MSLQGNKKNKRGSAFQRNNQLKREKKEELYMSKFSDKYHKDMKKRQKRSSTTKTGAERAKEMAKARIKSGKTIAQVKADNKEAMRKRAAEKHKAWKEARKNRKNKNKLQENTKRKSRYNSPNKR